MTAARDTLLENWPCVADALAREPGIRHPVALLMDFRSARARRLARLLCGEDRVEGLEAAGGPGGLVLVAVAGRRDAADALALVSPRAARRLRRTRASPGTALVVVVGDGCTSGRRVLRPAPQHG